MYKIVELYQEVFTRSDTVVKSCTIHFIFVGVKHILRINAGSFT